MLDVKHVDVNEKYRYLYALSRSNGVDIFSGIVLHLKRAKYIHLSLYWEFCKRGLQHILEDVNVNVSLYLNLQTVQKESILTTGNICTGITSKLSTYPIKIEFPNFTV